MIRGAYIAFVAVLGGCNVIFGVSDKEIGEPDPAAGGSSQGGDPGTGGEGAVTSAGGEMATGGQGPGPGGSGGVLSAGGAGGAGGAPPTLVDRGLMVRYFIDEAASGTMPPALLDAGPAPAFDLPIIYDNTQYVELPTGRGIELTGDHNGGATAQTITGTKLRDDLDGALASTLEIVFETAADNVLGYTFMFKQDGMLDGRFGIAVDDQFPYFEYNNNSPGTSDISAFWEQNTVASGRFVAHVVIDTTLADIGDRAILYADGVRIADRPPGGAMLIPPMQNDGVDTCENCSLTLGNTPGGTHPFRGTVYYAAIYNVALTAAERQNNLDLLLVNDDAP